MKLIFNKTTRRFMGTITGDTRGMPGDVILVDGPEPTIPETAHLNADNRTVSVKALSTAEQAARLPGSDLVPPVPKTYTREQFFALFTDAELFKWRDAVKKANAATTPNAAQKGLIAMEVRTGTVANFDMGNARTLAGFDLLVALNVLTKTRADEIKAF